MAPCRDCRPGFVCDPCVRRFPRVYLPPGEERERALRELEKLSYVTVAVPNAFGER